jgi:outer membrane protein OmpA-like peptidoglycan-associated protein
MIDRPFKNHPSQAFFAAFLPLAGVLLFSASVHAVDVQTHTSPANTVYMLNETGGLSSRGPLFFALDYNVLNDPLVELTPDRNTRINTLVDSIMTWDLTAGAKLGQSLSLNATLPLNLIHQLNQPRSFALGDTRVFAKVPLLGRDSAFQLSLVPELRIPTGDTSSFLSDGSVGYGALLAAEQSFRYFSLVGNLGYRYSTDAVFRDLDYRQKIPFGVGVGIPLGAKWSVNGEFAGARILPFNSNQNPSELYAGARYQVNSSVVLHAGGSLGTTSTVPSADYRILAGLKIEPQWDSGDRSNGQDTQVSPMAEVRGNRPGNEAGSAAAGAASGAGMEESDTLQSGQAKSTAPRVVLTPKRIEINQEIRFAHDSDRLLPDSKKVLDEVANLIAANHDQIQRLDVEGHTNELGSDAYNLKLSQRRAEAVRKYLVTRAVQEDKLNAEGYGKRRPKVGSEKLIRDVRLKVNRRVEFKLSEKGSG